MSQDVFQVVMLDVLREPFREWLRSRDLELVPIPVELGGLPTFTTTPTDEAMRRA